MGNANGREGGEGDMAGKDAGVDFPAGFLADSDRLARPLLSESMGNTPTESPRRSRSPLMFAPQMPIAPLQRASDLPLALGQSWVNNHHGTEDVPQENGIATLITWNHGGNNVVVEGSWDNWMSRTTLQRAGKDHVLLFVLPSGVYHYRFIVDGEWRYIPELPYETDEMGHLSNVLDVHEHVPESVESVSEFEAPLSPDSSYDQPFPVMADFAKEPPMVPPHLHLTVLGMRNQSDASHTTSRPHHVVLNHLFFEKGWASQSLVALGLTHRFQSKYVTVVLYKPLRR
ncbi:hypothetical protein AMTRI_Chr01g127790 [Amborella trichopoda]|uniref:SNF1-related protein kinase regulatory subunit beta-1 n=1 Tax=Amborella trichopoda TaxID=13333 RepID=UPI0005D2F02C|nr:SNF1-related protein kinase regulatory subunit beta-1 [Amborella trichopoda]|eukprot:XP_011620400.1 SNF1-related protein kinase regulatory subunit beta-1 [Amborella trichopoda]